MITWEYNSLEGAGFSFIITPNDKRFASATYSPSYEEKKHYLFTFLFKFVSDISGEVIYGYPRTDFISSSSFNPLVTNRYAVCGFTHTNNDNNFATYGYLTKINLTPGFYSYEAYEVFARSGTDFKAHNLAFMPADENNNFAPGVSADPNSMQVQGLVESGKALVREQSGSEQIKYIKHTETTNNYIYNG